MKAFDLRLKHPRSVQVSEPARSLNSSEEFRLRFGQRVQAISPRLSSSRRNGASFRFLSEDCAMRRFRSATLTVVFSHLPSAPASPSNFHWARQFGLLHTVFLS